jgi:hypothetical protein
LREGLGRVPQAEETPTSKLPTTVEQVRAMSWAQMEQVFAATYVDEIDRALRHGGDALLRERLAKLSEGERRILREALLEPELT